MIEDFLYGIKSYGRAFRKISELRLWGYFLLPGIISMLLGFGVYTFAGDVAHRFDAFLLSWYPFEWGRSLLQTASYWVGLILVWGSALMLFKHLILILASPFMSPLAQRIEKDILGIDASYQGFSPMRAFKEIMRGLTIAIRNIARELFYILLLLILSFLFPVIGPFLTVLIFLIQAYYAGFGNMDYTLERHYGVRGAAKFVKRNQAMAVGNGVVFLALVFTGVGILIAPPLATVAAALETVPRLEE